MFELSLRGAENLCAWLTEELQEEVLYPAVCYACLRLYKAPKRFLANHFSDTNGCWMQGIKLLSDIDQPSVVATGMPPRVVDSSLLTGMQVADFVGYIANPKYKRSAAYGEATRQVAPLRNQRVQPQLNPAQR